jgi:hypothetical protein
VTKTTQEERGEARRRWHPVKDSTLDRLLDDADELARRDEFDPRGECGECDEVKGLTTCYSCHTKAVCELTRLREGLEKLEAHNAYHMLRTRKGPVVCLSDIRALLDGEG